MTGIGVVAVMGAAVVVGTALAKWDIYIINKRIDRIAAKRSAELDAASDKDGNISWRTFMEIQKKYDLPKMRGVKK